MKAAVLNPQNFLPQGIEALFEEYGIFKVESLKDAWSGGADRCFVSFQENKNLPEFHELAADVQGVGIYDGIVQLNGREVPELCLKADLMAIIARKKWSLASHLPCFLSGDEVTLRWMVSFVLQAGFRKITIFHPRTDWAEDFMSHPGVEVEWMEAAQVASMSKNGGFLLIHFEGAAKPPAAMFEQIKYMHFLEDNAYFIDLSSHSQFEPKFLRAANKLVGIEAWQEILEHRIANKSFCTR